MTILSDKEKFLEEEIAILWKYSTLRKSKNSELRYPRLNCKQDGLLEVFGRQPKQEQLVGKNFPKVEYLFNGTVGTWTTTNPIELELRDPKIRPFHSEPSTVPYS
jgi:hypothetical protein